MGEILQALCALTVGVVVAAVAAKTLSWRSWRAHLREVRRNLKYTHPNLWRAINDRGTMDKNAADAARIARAQAEYDALDAATAPQKGTHFAEPPSESNVAEPWRVKRYDDLHRTAQVPVEMDTAFNAKSIVDTAVKHGAESYSPGLVMLARRVVQGAPDAYMVQRRSQDEWDTDWSTHNFSRDDCEQMVARLKANGVEARVVTAYVTLPYEGNDG